MVANIITCTRIVCALSLIICPTFSIWFYVLYFIGSISDVLDGIAARRFGKETKFGARLDTIADIVFMGVVIIKILRTVDFPLWLLIWIVSIAVIKVVNIISGFVLYKRFISEHTVMNKICGVLLFALPLCIGRLPWLSALVLMILTCVASTFSAVQEGHLIRSGKEIR